MSTLLRKRKKIYVSVHGAKIGWRVNDCMGTAGIDIDVEAGLHR
jgi:hypothetical protein